MKFEKASDSSWIRRVERPPAQAQGQGQVHPRVEKEAEIQKMEGRLDHQRGFEQREPKLDIPLLLFEGVQIEATFPKSIMFELAYIVGPSSQPSFTELSHTETAPHQTPHVPDHAPWMDLSTQISSLGIFTEELTVVSETRFYSMEDCMDRYQTNFTSQFEYLQQRFERMEDHMDQQQAAFDYLQQRIERIESRQECQHEEMMAYLHSVFPLPQP